MSALIRNIYKRTLKAWQALFKKAQLVWYSVRTILKAAVVARAEIIELYFIYLRELSEVSHLVNWAIPFEKLQIKI